MFNLKKSCWNCKLSIKYRTRAIPQTYWEPGEPAMVEDCDSQLGANNWEQWDEDFDRDNEGHNELEEFIAYKCPDYTPEPCSCEVCNKETNLINAITIHNPYDLSHTCSYTCATILKMRIDKEIEELKGDII